MSSDAARFDTIIASLLRDPAQRANGRDLRRAYESLKHMNDSLNEDLDTERREHDEAVQTLNDKEIVNLRAELERTKTAAEHYKNQAHTASLTLNNLNVRLEQIMEEKRQAENKVKELTDENTAFPEPALPPFKPVAVDLTNARLQKPRPTSSDQSSSSVQRTTRSRKRLADTVNEEVPAHDRPAKRPRNAKVADGIARISAVSSSKLSVRRYVTSSTPSIWDAS
ncbi:hypothetical protein PENSPDRAFT_215684 [Peniophora sp. CONT]|nr:hypothetical protein PENSPDRAFT_215684 [Peniophora sp. CONT]